ncbi:Major facilitator superfamily protein [Euphorbia peplus]|nr:Major facilitator superfamily protein [Euphorbia peplus]
MDPETEMQSSNSKKKGSWITFPFILGTSACLSLAAGGWIANLIVYLIEEFNVKSIDAAQIANRVSGGVNFSPIIGAVIADSFLGAFTVVAISCFISFLASLLITLTSVIDSLRPKPCQVGSSTCQSPSKFQYALLYTDLVLGCIGYGPARFTLSTLGANQFDKPEDQYSFFNWYFFVAYTFSIISFTGLVYIQDNVSWGLGFGIVLGANFVALVVFVAGFKFYRHEKPKGSPFVSFAKVLVACVRKMKMPTSVQNLNCGNDAIQNEHHLPPQLTNTFRFLNKAAMEAEGDKNPDGSIAKPWRLCTVQQVEDFKELIKMVPIWSTSLLLAVELAIGQASLVVLQALMMNRHLGHLKIPAASISVVALISTSISLSIIDRFFPLLWRKVMGKLPTPLQTIGIGHVGIIVGIAVSALVEKRRRGMFVDGKVMSAVWLFPQLILLGIGEAFYLPKQVALYYQELPESLHGTATALTPLIGGIAFYVSTSLVDTVRAHTNWLHDNINEGKLDNMYWLLVVLGSINFCYFLICAKFFKYKQNYEKVVVETVSGSTH